MSTVECEIGPAGVRRYPRGRADPDPEWVAAALAGGDDALTLVADRAVAVCDAWRSVLDDLLDGADEVVLVHPSWWPRRRVDTVVAAAAGPGREVTARPRSATVAGGVWLEIAAHLVLVGVGAPAAAVVRRTARPEADADAVVAAVPGFATEVCLDAPSAVPGADVLASLIEKRLRGRHIRPRRARVVCAEDTAPRTGGTDAARPRRRLRRNATAVGLGTAAALALAALAARNPDGAAAAVALVQDRVTVQVPAGWAVERITEGPGSARVQVSSSPETAAALHITQAWVPADTLGAAAAALQRAIRAEPAGVFVDFRPDDVVAGRHAVTYREVRPRRVIRWAVFVDGGVRIGIGCASPPGGESAVARACERAIRSAHRIG